MYYTIFDKSIGIDLLKLEYIHIILCIFLSEENINLNIFKKLNLYSKFRLFALKKKI